MSYDDGGRVFRGKDGGRGTGRGENARAATLTDEQVRAIKLAPRKGALRVSNAYLARQYGVSATHISAIRTGRKRAEVQV